MKYSRSYIRSIQTDILITARNIVTKGYYPNRVSDNLILQNIFY